jgi:hypothetical protein
MWLVLNCSSYITLHGINNVKSTWNLLYPPLDMDNKTKTRIIKTTSVVSVCLRSQRSWTNCSNKMCLVWVMFWCCFKTSRFENNVTIKFRLACKQWQYNVFSKWRDVPWFGVIAVALVQLKYSELRLLTSVRIWHHFLNLSWDFSFICQRPLH